MNLFCLRRALLCASLTFCLSSLAARAQDAAPAENISPVPVPVEPENAAPDATTATATATTATAAAPRKTPTPEERRQQTEDKLRALMANLGVTAAATQDSIIDYLADDELQRAGLREAEKSLLAGLRRDVPPERLRDLLSDYRAAIETDKTNRVAAQRRLDARVGYSLDPKLEATLWLMGVLGEGAAKLPTSALSVRKAETPAENAPLYGPAPDANFGARGIIVGTVTAKGIEESGQHWLEIRDDSGASERYRAPWRDDLNALDPQIEKQLSDAPLGTRLRVQWAWKENRRALLLQPEDAPQPVAKTATP